MGKPVIAVAFAPAAPIGFFDTMLHELDADSGGKIRYMNCAEVHETSYGFLQLLPVVEDGEPVMAVYVPPHYVLWMVKGAQGARLGFV